MPDRKWIDFEKKTARRVFEVALAAELAEVMADFKQKATGVSTEDEMWMHESDLRELSDEKIGAIGRIAAL